MVTITNTVVIKNAKAETGNGKYDVEYIITNGQMTRVNASISEPGEDNTGCGLFVGNITLDNETITCALPAGSHVSGYFEDFNRFITQIRGDVVEKIPNKIK